MMMADEQTRLKAGIEFNDDAPAIGSVLTLTHSDWATGLFPGDPRTFWLRLTRKGDALRLQYSTDGEHWPLLRLGYFPPGPVKAASCAAHRSVADWRLRFRIFSFPRRWTKRCTI